MPPSPLPAFAAAVLSSPRARRPADPDGHSTIYFHNPKKVRADEWMFTEMESPWSGDGRGVVIQRIFSKDGTLLATCFQEVSEALHAALWPSSRFADCAVFFSRASSG